MTDQSKSNERLILAIVTAVAGILAFTLVPLLVVGAMDAVLKGAAIKIPASGNPLLTTAPFIVKTFFPFWGGLSMASGVALVIIAWPIYKGEVWARPAAVGLLAVPSITGAYLSGPVMFFGRSALPNFILVMAIGLIPYFTVLLWRRATWREKLGDFFLFLMLGVTAAWSFANGGSSLRMLMARPDVLDAGQYGFAMGIPTVWIGVAATIVAIPFLVANTRFGWRLAGAGLLIILVGSTTLFITHPGTREFLIGMIMALVSLGLLAAPFIGGRLGRETDRPGIEPRMSAATR